MKEPALTVRRDASFDRPLKIGVLAHLKHPIKEPYAGGLEMHTHHLSECLRDRGHAVTLFAAEGSEPRGLEAVSSPTRGMDDFFYREHLAYRRLMHELKRRDFDIIHNNSLHYLAVAMADDLPMPVITTLHTPPFWELEGSMRLARSAEHVFVAVSETLRSAWQTIDTIGHVVSNGIDLARFPYREKPDETPYLIWFGRIVPEKGLHLAMDAAASADMPLRVAGPISDQAYFKRCIAPRMHARVRYLGHLPHAELAVVIGGACASLFTPLWDEPYGLVVAESLSCGTPVASFARGAVPTVLDDQSGVLVPPNDVRGLGEAAIACRTLSREACRRRAEKVADSNTMITRYESLYRESIRRHRRKTSRYRPVMNAAAIVPSQDALVDFYARHLPDMLCEQPCPA